MKHIILSCVAALLLGACAAYAPVVENDPLANYGPLSVRVSSVDVKNTYNPITTTSDAAYKYAVPPAKWFERYARKRFVASGVDMGIIRFTITQASAIEREIPATTTFSLGNPHEQAITLNVQMELMGQPNLTAGRANFSAQNVITFPENASLATREASLQQGVIGMIGEIDRQIVHALRDGYKVLGKSVVDTTQFTQPIN